MVLIVGAAAAAAEAAAGVPAYLGGNIEKELAQSCCQVPPGPLASIRCKCICQRFHQAWHDMLVSRHSAQA